MLHQELRVGSWQSAKAAGDLAVPRAARGVVHHGENGVADAIVVRVELAITSRRLNADQGRGTELVHHHAPTAAERAKLKDEFERNGPP
jgi:hypothetical protein